MINISINLPQMRIIINIILDEMGIDVKKCHRPNREKEIWC